jgi:DNA helicase TIP49 (TBP-interacting protein)
VEDVQRVDELFMDVAEAAEYLRKHEEKLLVH